MGIENEMLIRFNEVSMKSKISEKTISSELDFFFDNVLDTIVDYFSETVEVK